MGHCSSHHLVVSSGSLLLLLYPSPLSFSVMFLGGRLGSITEGGFWGPLN